MDDQFKKDYLKIEKDENGDYVINFNNKDKKKKKKQINLSKKLKKMFNVTLTYKGKALSVFDRKLIRKDQLQQIFDVNQPKYKMQKTIEKIEEEQKKKIKELKEKAKMQENQIKGLQKQQQKKEKEREKERKGAERYQKESKKRQELQLQLRDNFDDFYDKSIKSIQKNVELYNDIEDFPIYTEDFLNQFYKNVNKGIKEIEDNKFDYENKRDQKAAKESGYLFLRKTDNYQIKSNIDKIKRMLYEDITQEELNEEDIDIQDKKVYEMSKELKENLPFIYLKKSSPEFTYYSDFDIRPKGKNVEDIELDDFIDQHKEIIQKAFQKTFDQIEKPILGDKTKEKTKEKIDSLKQDKDLKKELQDEIIQYSKKKEDLFDQFGANRFKFQIFNKLRTKLLNKLEDKGFSEASYITSLIKKNMKKNDEIDSQYSQDLEYELIGFENIDDPDFFQQLAQQYEEEEEERENLNLLGLSKEDFEQKQIKNILDKTVDKAILNAENEQKPLKEYEKDKKQVQQVQQVQQDKKQIQQNKKEEEIIQKDAGNGVYQSAKKQIEKNSQLESFTLENVNYQINLLLDSFNKQNKFVKLLQYDKITDLPNYKDTNVIIVYLVKKHYSIAIIDNKKNQIVYFDSYGEISKKIEQQLINYKEKNMKEKDVQFKINRINIQGNLEKEDILKGVKEYKICGLLNILFLKQYLKGGKFKDITNYNEFKDDLKDKAEFNII